MTRDFSRDPALSRPRIIAALAANPGLSRKDLSERLQIGRGTVTEQVRRLIQARIIAELPAEVQGAGRPRVPLVIGPGAGFALGVDIEPDHVVVLAVSLSGEVLRAESVPFDAAAPERAARLGQIIAPWLSQSDKGRCAAVGIALSGVIQGPEVLVSVILRWRHERIGNELERVIGRRVWMANDMEALAFREDLRIQEDSESNFLLISLGAGVGMAIVRGDRSQREIGGVASEFGHVSVDPNGPLCGCGNHGCIETYVAAEDLTRRVSEADPHGGALRIEDMAESPIAAAVIADSAYRLGRAIGGAATLTGIQRITLTGALIDLWEPSTAQIRLGIDETTRTLVSPCELVWAPWSETSVAAGAAALALSRTLADGTSNL